MAGTPVTLSNGAKAYFTHSTCGASCSDSTVTWIAGAYQYAVGLKAGLEANVVQLANSMQTY
jgi:hypothetical protein